MAGGMVGGARRGGSHLNLCVRWFSNYWKFNCWESFIDLLTNREPFHISYKPEMLQVAQATNAMN